MTHTVVQMYKVSQHLPQSPMNKCQIHQPCRHYNITIPNSLNMSGTTLTSSDDDDIHHSPNAEPTSFVSIDGDYDEEETPNVIGYSSGSGDGGGGVFIVNVGVATAPPLEDDEYNVTTCENNKSTPTTLQQTEEETCIICYEKVQEKDGNFYTNFCDTCKYTVHIPCIEEYIIRKLRDDVQTMQSRFVGIKCLLCSKVVESSELTQEEFDEINNSGNGMNGINRNRMTAQQRRDMELHEHALRIMERQIRRDRIHNRKRFVCQVCFIVCLILCAGGVLASVITKNK